MDSEGKEETDFFWSLWVVLYSIDYEGQLPTSKIKILAKGWTSPRAGPERRQIDACYRCKWKKGPCWGIPQGGKESQKKLVVLRGGDCSFICVPCSRWFGGHLLAKKKLSRQR